MNADARRWKTGVICVCLCSSVVSLSAELRAGASKITITPDLQKHGPVYMAGFGRNRKATGIHDDLYARCLALATGTRPLVICSIDSIGLFLDDVQKIRAAVPAADVVVASTHVHEAPDTMGLWGPSPEKSGINETYNSFVVDRTAQAARDAVRALQPALATLADVHTAELDAFIHDTRPPVVHDAGMVVLSLTTAAGKTIAAAVNWANHPETLGSKNTGITADYPAFLCARLEEQLGGMAALWNGAVGGMQSPLGAEVKDPQTGRPAPENSFRKAEIIGRRVADIAVDAIQAEKPAPIDVIMFRERMIRIPVTNAGFKLADAADLYRGRKKMEDGATITPVGAVRMLDGTRPVLEIALIPGELYPELSIGGVERYTGADFSDAPVEPAIKRFLKAEHRMLIGLADDEIGYIIPKAEWDEKAPYLNNAAKRWYGEVNSVGPEAASRIAAALQELFR
jgi:hypothetical protein